MINLLIFILSTAGLVWVMNKSKITRPLREAISLKYKTSPNGLLWFLDSILECSGCMGVWAGLAVYTLQYYNIEIALYAFIGSFCSVFLISLLQAIDRK